MIDCMATIQVRGVTEETLTVLSGRAVRAGETLQGYVRQLLEEAATLTTEEAAERSGDIAGRGAVTADDVVDAIADMRDARG
jgi:antitoxin FitA